MRNQQPDPVLYPTHHTNDGDLTVCHTKSTRTGHTFICVNDKPRQAVVYARLQPRPAKVDMAFYYANGHLTTTPELPCHDRAKALALSMIGELITRALGRS